MSFMALANIITVGLCRLWFQQDNASQGLLSKAVIWDVYF